MTRPARRPHVLTLLALALTGPAHAQTAVTAQLTAPAAATTATRATGVFPTSAAPGETAWIYGPTRLPPQGQLAVGGQLTMYRQDPISGWLAFQVPAKAAGGPQTLTLRGANQTLKLNVLLVPPGTDALVYVRPEASTSVQAEYSRRLRALAESCAKRCPAQVQAVLKSLSAQQPPTLTPLTQTQTAPGAGSATAAIRPAPLAARPPQLNLNTLNAANLTQLMAPGARSAPSSSICQLLTGTVPTAGLPLGQVLTLLELIFAGDLQTDPTRVGWPDQGSGVPHWPGQPGDPPYAKVPPAEMLARTLAFKGGSGKGVTIHVLDTASATDDPATFSGQYYNVIFTNRPGHGRAVGQIAQAVAPAASVDFHPVCDRDGTCSTLKVAQALCAVAAEARRGGRHVVNLSLGGPNPTRGLELALREVTALGAPVAASFGNRDDCAGLVRGDRCNHYPADWTHAFEFGPALNLASRSLRPTMLLSVAGWDIAGRQLATYNRGVGNPGVLTELPSVQAPGEFWLGSPMFPYFGTSFAAPVVSGVLASWMSCQPGVPLLPLLPGDQAPIPASVMNACP